MFVFYITVLKIYIDKKGGGWYNDTYQIVICEGEQIMKKIRILALILALLMLPISILVGCNKKDGDDNTDPSECKHKWNKWVEIAERDCTHEQIRERTCRLCGHKETETKAPWGHSLTSWVSDNNASCTEDGTRSKKCQLCDYSESSADPGSALGHTFPDSRYSVSDDDEYIEVATCVKCEAATDSRLLGLKIDFEGDKSHLSYTKLDEYFIEGAGSVETKTEGEGETANTYLSISRIDDVFAGNSAFGVIITPRADMLKGTSLVAAPYYVVEFDVRISKTETKDLVLLSGTKKGATENFIKYNSADGTLVTAAGALYTLKDEDYDRWLKIGVVLNDGSKEYTVYVDDYQLIYADGDDSVATEIGYATVDGYYLGYDLENLKIGLAPEVGVASKFDIDNIRHYLGAQPKDYKGSADAEYFIYTTANSDKIVYKLADEDCTHVWGDATVVLHTCVSTGYSIKTCSVCGGQEIFDISTEALGQHNFIAGDVIPATCTEAEFRNEKCDICGLKNGMSVGSPLGHEIDNDAETTTVFDPTCTARGFTSGICIRCGITHETDYVNALGHEIDMDKPETYEIIAPTCLADGYTKGQCKRCDLADYITDETEALGHLLDPEAEDYVKVEADCVTDGYEESTCGREGCSEKYKTNEVEAFGHSIVSEIKEVPVEGSTTGETKRVIASKCVRCDDADAQRDLSTKIPTYTEIASIIGEANMLGAADAGRLLHFDTVQGMTYGDDTAANGSGLKNALVARFSKYVIKEDLYNAGNGYMEWVYSPKNGLDANGNPTYSDPPTNKTEISRHSYFDFSTGRTVAGQDVTFEISLRVPEGATENIPLSINVMDRTGIHFKKADGTAANHDVVFLNVSTAGAVTLASGQKIAQLVQQDWTRLAFVFHTTNATYDVYVDGVMIEKNVMIELVKPNQDAFDMIDYGFRVNAGDNKAANTRKIDVDEVYAYYSSVPSYVTDVKINEKTGLSAFEDDSKNTPASGDYNAPYLSAFAFYNKDAQRYIELSTKSNARFFIDSANGNAIHLLKNSSVANVPGATSGNDSFININIGYAATKKDVVDLGALKYQYKTIVFETEFVINEGTGDFSILMGRKNNDKSYYFLQYKNGNIVSGSDIIVENAEIGHKYTLALVMREDAFNYDIYVDGYLMRERVAYSDAYCVQDISTAMLFRTFITTAADADVLINSIKITGGLETPELNLGRASFVKVDGNFVTHAVVFTEDYDYSVHYPSTKKANGDYVYNSGNSTLTIVSGLEKAENDLNLGLIKVDKDGKTGDEAVNEPVWALKTGDWGANCTTSSGELNGLTLYPQNVPMKSGYYDFTGYESITFKYYVAESAGYTFLITMNCPQVPNPNDATKKLNCYYTKYVTIEPGTTGWQELTFDFSEFGKNNTVALDKIQNICFNFSGWAGGGVGAAGGEAGKCGSGTTLYIAGIDLTSKTSEKMVGLYVETSDKFCGEGNHTMGEVVTVDPTAHIDGYSYKACSVDGCGYVEIVEEFEGTALGHVATGAPNADSAEASCTAEGKVLYDVSCENCGNIVIGGKLFKEAHNWVKSEAEGASKGATCTEDGYDTYTCDGCNATAKVIFTKLGHTKDENVDTVVVEADCTNGGYKQDHCSVCGQDYKYDEVDALDHTRDEEVLNEGGCEEDRVVKYTCSRCDWEDIVSTEGPGHSWTPWETIIEASCGDGLERRECKECDHFEENVLPGSGAHDYDKTETPADCGNNGERSWTCKVCGDNYTETLIATGDHKYDTEEHTKQPSVTEEGYTYNEGSGCGRHKVLTTIPATFEGTQDLKFDITGDTAIIEKYTGEATEIVIPGTYAGKPVVVSKNAFNGNTKITSVTIGDGATVAQKAFMGCTALETVVLGEGMTDIATSTFEGCTSLETIVIPESVTSIGMFAFKGCDALTTVNYAGATKLVAGGNFKANGNDKFFGAEWNCNYEA